MTTISRYRGSLLGLAVGDALGTTLEFKSPGTFTPIKDMVGGGPFNLEPGEWTDDTSMALCLAESLIEKEKFDPIDQMQRYLKWYREGHLSSNGKCFDIGNTVHNALIKFEKTKDPYCGSEDPKFAGNDADVVMTDTFTSIHTSDPKQTEKFLPSFQVNESLMEKAKKHAIFMHCLPAKRDQEVTSAVIDGPQSVIWDEAENRLHTQKALLLSLFGI